MLETISITGAGEIFLQIVLATVLGAAIGVERELARKTAGMRTYALVALGSALFTILSKYPSVEFMLSKGFDPSRIASQIVTGIGFLGAGVIFFSQKEDKVKGLTTAASLWVAAAIGMTVGFGLYSVAAFATLVVILVLILFWYLEFKLIKPLATKRHLEEERD